jgi:hypothetical protein
MVIFFTRATTEVIMQPNAILAGEFFVMMTYFIYVMDRGARSNKPSPMQLPHKNQLKKLSDRADK